jgi:hypothetical protein
MPAFMACHIKTHIAKNATTIKELHAFVPFLFPKISCPGHYMYTILAIAGIVLTPASALTSYTVSTIFPLPLYLDSYIVPSATRTSYLAVMRMWNGHCRKGAAEYYPVDKPWWLPR